MKFLNKILSLLIVSVLITACSDILDVEPVSMITVESFWESEEDAISAVNGMYVLYRNQMATNLLWWGEARGGTVSYGLQAPEGRERFFENTLNPENAGPNWRALYWIIHQTNLVLKYTLDINFTNENRKNRLLAEAHAMRAHIYFIMARTWGGVPLVLEPTEGFDPDEMFRQRADIESVFSSIKSDIDDALALFPGNEIPNRAKWTAPSVNALKADVYLWTAKQLNGGEADFQTALDATEQVADANVSLLDNYEDIFDFNNKKNEEILLAAHYGRDESGGNYGGEIYIRGDQIPADIDEDIRERVGTGGGLNRVSPSALLREQFSEEDERRVVTFTEIITEDNGEESLFASVANKFRGTVEDGSRIFVSDLIIYRYADVLLLQAEAKNALGQDPTTEINVIRNRAGLDDYTGPTDQESLDDAILQERLLELALEGKRWWDVVRFDRAFDLVPSLQDRAGQDHLLLWPISTNTIILNSQIEQNPGY